MLHPLWQVNVPQFMVGDLVRVSSDLAKVQSLQSGHGEWNESVVLVRMGSGGRGECVESVVLVRMGSGGRGECRNEAVHMYMHLHVQYI